MKSFALILALSLFATACASAPGDSNNTQPTPEVTIVETQSATSHAGQTPEATATSGTNATESPIVKSTTAALPQTPNTNILWLSDFEDGTLSQWYSFFGGGIYNLGSGNVTITDKFAHSGRYSAAMIIDDGDGVSQAVRLFRWHENPVEAYYGVWLLFPEQYKPASWWNVLQFKTSAPYPLDTIWVVNVGNRPNGEMYFYLYDWQKQNTYIQSVRNIPVGQWVHLEVHYLRSTEEAGRIAVWQDGDPLLDLDKVRTATSDNVHWSVDNYTDRISPSPATIYVDDATISKERLEK